MLAFAHSLFDDFSAPDDSFCHSHAIFGDCCSKITCRLDHSISIYSMIKRKEWKKSRSYCEYLIFYYTGSTCRNEISKPLTQWRSQNLTIEKALKVSQLYNYLGYILCKTVNRHRYRERSSFKLSQQCYKNGIFCLTNFSNMNNNNNNNTTIAKRKLSSLICNYAILLHYYLNDSINESNFNF